MNLEQLRAWLDQHGGYSDSIPTKRSVVKKTPAGDISSEEQVTIMVAADGSQITVRDAGADTYEVVGEPKLAAPAKTTEPGASRTPEKVAQDAEDERERVYNASQPGGFRETHLEKRKREAQEAKDAPKPPARTDTKTEHVNGQQVTTKTVDGAVAGTDVQPLPASATDKPQVISAPVNAKFILVEKDGQLTQVPNPNYQPSVESPYTTAQQDPQTGEWFGLKKTGGWEKIEGGPGIKKPSMATEPLPPGMTIGQLTGVAESVRDKIMARVKSGDITIEDGLAAYESSLGLIETLGNETDTILRTQGNILTNQTANRSATLQDQASRRTFGSDLLQNSFKNVMSAGLPMGQGAQAMPAFLAYYLLGMGTAGAVGGLEQRPEPGLAPAQQQVMQQGLPQTGGPQGIKLTMADGTKLETVPQSIQNATQMPSDMTPPPGMRVDGGQLRAPGYRAVDEPDPEAMPGFMPRVFA